MLSGTYTLASIRINGKEDPKFIRDYSSPKRAMSAIQTTVRRAGYEWQVADMWREGSIKIGEDIFHYWIKQYGGGSIYGIEGGRISKLMIRRGGEIVCNYDRGWDVNPVDEGVHIALAIILRDYNQAYSTCHQLHW